MKDKAAHTGRFRSAGWESLPDLLFFGIASTVALLVVSVFPAPFLAIGASPDRMLVLNAVISYPHIIASFFLFYGPNGNSRHHPFRAFALPLLIVAFLIFLVLQESTTPLIWAAQVGFMYFYWHFLMQGMGCALWMLGPETRPALRRRIRGATFLAAFLIALCGYLALHQSEATENIFALPLPGLPVPMSWKGALESIPILTTLLYFIYLARLAPEIGLSAVFGVFLPILSLSLWFSPFLVHSPYRVLIQFLHGLQFLGFYRKTLIKTHPAPSHDRFAPFSLRWAGFSIIGLAAFAWIPAKIEALMGSGPADATGRIVSAFALFLNVHHYSVDGTLWKMANSWNRKRLGLPAL